MRPLRRLQLLLLRLRRPLGRRRLRVVFCECLARAPADTLCGTVRCAFPLGSLALWVVLLFGDQGKDVLRHVIEAWADEQRFRHLIWLAAASAGLGLSVWYSMRWMLTVQLPALRFYSPRSRWFRRVLPRLAGAGAAWLVALCILWKVSIAPELWLAWLQVAAAFVLLGGLLMAFFLLRARIFKRIARRNGKTPGRDLQGKPSLLRQDAPLPRKTRQVLGWTIASLTMGSIIFTVVPIAPPRAMGSAAAPAVAIACINLVGTFLLTYLPLRKGIPPLAPALLLGVALLGYLNDNHTLLDAPEVQPGVAQPRPELRAALVAWLAAQGIHEEPGKSLRKVPVILVASEGGGIRAAYWTAAVLDQLRLPRASSNPGFAPDRHILALSGVSGGSLGVASWLAAARASLCPQPGVASTKPATPPPTASAALSQDFLAPALVGLFYYDFFQRFVPWPFPWFDRSHALEEGWERAHANLEGAPFEHTMASLYAGCPQLPLLLLNTTVVESGQRGIMGPVALGGWARDAVDLMEPQWTTSTQPLSGLVHHSARFPIVSPPGSVETQAGRGSDRDARFVRAHRPDTQKRLVDGGYYDNSGVQTALDLFIAIKRMQAEQALVPNVELQPVLLSITNSGGAAQPCEKDPAKAVPAGDAQYGSVSHVFYDLLSPIKALVSVRDSHTRIMMVEARERFGDQNVFEVPMPRNVKGADPALGWSLSKYATDYMTGQAVCAVDVVLRGLSKAVSP